MSKRKLVDRIIWDVMDLEVDTSLPEFIAALQADLEKIPPERRDTTRVVIKFDENYYDDGGGRGTGKIWYTSKETDEEYKSRAKEDARNKRVLREREVAQLRYLKDKYGDT